MGVAAEGGRGGLERSVAGDEYVLGLDVAVEELVGVYVVEARQDLEEYGLDGLGLEGLVFSRLHELVEVAVHVLHADVQLLGARVEEDVIRGHQVRVLRQRAQEDDLAEIQTLGEGVVRLLHRLDGDLQRAPVSKTRPVIAVKS